MKQISSAVCRSVNIMTNRQRPKYEELKQSWSGVRLRLMRIIVQKLVRWYDVFGRFVNIKSCDHGVVPGSRRVHLKVTLTAKYIKHQIIILMAFTCRFVMRDNWSWLHTTENWCAAVTGSHWSHWSLHVERLRGTYFQCKLDSSRSCSGSYSAGDTWS